MQNAHFECKVIDCTLIFLKTHYNTECHIKCTSYIMAKSVHPRHCIYKYFENAGGGQLPFLCDTNFELKWD